MNKHVAVIQLAKEGVEMHGKNDPEYIVCAEVLRLNEVNQELLEALKEITLVQNESPVIMYQAMEDIARAAIAKAEGKSK